MGIKSFPRLGLLAISFVVGLQLGCHRKRPELRENWFRSAISSDVKTLDPANAFDAISLSVVPQIYETLYQYHYLAEPLQLVPLLAADFPKFSDDQKTVTIQIRSGLKFQDDPCFEKTNGKGREVVAQDFVYAWKRLAVPSIQSSGLWIFDGKVNGFSAFHKRLTQASPNDRKILFETTPVGLKALDATTIQIQLERPFPQLLFVLAMTFTAPVPFEAVDKYGDADGNLVDYAVGTGPFLLKNWSRGQKIELTRNPNFHDDFYPRTAAPRYEKLGLLQDSGKLLPFLDRITFEVIKESQPSWLAFLKGELDVTGIPKDSYSTAIVDGNRLSEKLEKRNLSLHIEPSQKFYFLGFNLKDSFLGKNKLVRQAIASAISREKWIELFTNGRAEKALSTIPPGIADRPSDARLKYDYDPIKALSLLAEAGFPGGKGLPVLNFDFRGADSVNRQLGEFMAQQLSEVGIKINVILNTLPAYLEKEKKGNLQLFYGGWIMDYPDAENVMQLLYGPNQPPGPNAASFDHPQFNRFYQQIAIMPAGPARAKLIAEMDAIVQEEVPWALGFVSKNYELSQTWVKNFRSAEVISNFYKYLRVDGLKRQKVLTE